MKKSEVDFADEHFLYKKIENKAVYVDYSATEDIPEDARSWGTMEIWQHWN